MADVDVVRLPADVAAARPALLRVLAGAPEQVVLDLRSLATLDVRMIGMVTAAAHHAAAIGTRLAVRHVSPAVRAALLSLGLAVLD